MFLRQMDGDQVKRKHTNICLNVICSTNQIAVLSAASLKEQERAQQVKKALNLCDEMSLPSNCMLVIFSQRGTYSDYKANIYRIFIHNCQNTEISQMIQQIKGCARQTMYVHTMQVKTNGIQDNLDASPISLNKTMAFYKVSYHLWNLKRMIYRWSLGQGGTSNR